MNELLFLVVGVGGLAAVASNLHGMINPSPIHLVTRHARIHPETRFAGTSRVANKRADTKGKTLHSGDISDFKGQHIRDRKKKGMINAAGGTKLFDEMFRQRDFIEIRMKRGRYGEHMSHRYRL